MARRRKNSDENAAQLESAPAQQDAEQKIDFESWFALRKKQIPAHHRKEIIKADFKARKVSDMATMAEFDDALRKYGIRLG